MGAGNQPVIAIFGPTGIGKTGVAIQLAGMLRERGEDAVAVNCDSMQVYRPVPNRSPPATRPARPGIWSATRPSTCMAASAST